MAGDRLDSPWYVQEGIKENERFLSRFRGCLLGGAAGDALGYPVEFMSFEQIRSRYGGDGIADYDIDAATGKALISDDTQMTLFTANAILIGDTRQALRGISGDASCYANHTYRDWLHTQDASFEDYPGDSWLLQVPELHQRRAPGATCLSALYEMKQNDCAPARNNSKGCGGVMRVAPAGLYFENPREAARHACGLAALTHGHPLGYIAAAVFASIICRCAHEGRDGQSRPADALADFVRTSCEEMEVQFADHPREVACMRNYLERAVALAESDQGDVEAIAQLGEGWVAEEALAIAVFSALRYFDDFSAAICCAVNHDGDSDSTGSLCGNIVGALLGIEAIASKWLERLELRAVLETIAKDLCDRCQMSAYDDYEDDEWLDKYVYVRNGAIG